MSNEREIKFRAWDKKYNKMYYGDIKMVLNYPLEDVEIMQFTGLKDKNNRDAYHKDIIASGKKLFIIEWQKEEARFLLLPTGNNTGTWKFMDEINHMEIIGNIYEHKHLIQSK